MVKNSSTLRKYFTLFLYFSYSLSFAQNSITDDSFAGLSAFESFQERKYEQVISTLSTDQSLSEDEEILLRLSELKTGKGDENRIERWLKANPKHPIKPLVSYHLGEYYFYNGDTTQAKVKLKGISGPSLSKTDRASYGYVYGLLMLNDAQHKNASNLFDFSRANEFPDLENLDYYQGYAEYHLGQNANALDRFERIKSSDKFGNSAKYFIAKMRLENGESDAVIALAQSELSDEKSITNSGFHQLIGEAYALNDKVAKADAFFERAIELHPGKPSAALYYQSGVAKFRIGNEEKAIEFLRQSGIQGGEYAQLSAFQLGRLYLKKQDFENALTAYIEASASENDQMKEEALYQTANIHARLDQYTQAINYAIDYLKSYDNPQKTEALQNLIAQSYLKTSNYDLAIEHLNEIGISNETQKSVYQKVSFQKAVLLFNDGSFKESKRWFLESLKYPLDMEVKDESYHHLGEISLQGRQYDDAIRYYESQSARSAISCYGLGYAYYNKRQYQTAISYFRSALTATNESIRNDANVRLADCLYATKDYQEAFNIYRKLSTSISASYLTFQQGMSLKNLDRKDEAIRQLSTLFNDGRYASQAKYQSGMIAFESADFQNAESYFSKLIAEHLDDPFMDESLLNRGIARKNLGKLDQAKTDYEKILNEYLGSESAINAILGLQELQQAGVNVGNLNKYIGQFKDVNPESGSLELIEFEAAKRLYFDFAYQEAAEAFGKYLKDYPTTGNLNEALYYQGDSYYRIDELALAKPLFDELKLIRSPLTGRVLNRLGDINSRLNLTNDAEEVYQLLADLNLTPKDTYNAKYGLMKLYFDTEAYDQAIQVADQLLVLDWQPLNAQQEATLVKARSWMKLNELDNAKEEWEKLAIGKDEYAAEANYHLGLIAFQSSKFDESLDILFQLNADFGSYTNWVDQSYLLIAKNYIEKEELFQAKATLRSIIQHSKNEEVVIQSNQLLAQIEQEAAETDTTSIKD